jgi:hypothetical protein
VANHTICIAEIKLELNWAQGEGEVFTGGIKSLNEQPRYYIKNFDRGALGVITSFDLNAGYLYSPHFNIGGGALRNSLQEND